MDAFEEAFTCILFHKVHILSFFFLRMILLSFSWNFTFLKETQKAIELVK